MCPSPQIFSSLPFGQSGRPSQTQSSEIHFSSESSHLKLWFKPQVCSWVQSWTVSLILKKKRINDLLNMHIKYMSSKCKIKSDYTRTRLQSIWYLSTSEIEFFNFDLINSCKRLESVILCHIQDTIPVLERNFWFGLVQNFHVEFQIFLDSRHVYQVFWSKYHGIPVIL